ncbi:hypothetical protein HZH68_004665 [Vespula germanica]|uniref:Uncharacterized protein n=1 Tax=Vespula germanica TaxID=30212 RepID=A0A834NJM3_VESGE|nr:hypothetical protein HZH68_004665 [Vespula germanica]
MPPGGAWWCTGATPGTFDKVMNYDASRLEKQKAFHRDKNEKEEEEEEEKVKEEKEEEEEEEEDDDDDNDNDHDDDDNDDLFLPTW